MTHPPAAAVLLCDHHGRSEVAAELAKLVRDGSATVADVMACTSDKVARALAYKASPEELAEHDFHILIAIGSGATRRYVAGCLGPWTAEQALAHWEGRSDERAKLFAEAIRKDLERDR